MKLNESFLQTLIENQVTISNIYLFTSARTCPADEKNIMKLEI